VEKGSENISRRQVCLALAALFALNLVLRVFYLRYDFVNGDEGVRALTAVRILDGARLYADLVIDKPPGASLFYAAVFSLFGRTMKAVHLAATLWNFGTSLVVYFTASRFYGKRTALCAGLFFVYFSTNYFTQDVMAANDELLMALPYAGAFYFFAKAEVGQRVGRHEVGALVAAGLMTGVAGMFKQVGVLNLMFFALYECIAVVVRKRSDDEFSLKVLLRRSFVRLLLIGSGFVAVLLLFGLVLAKLDALGEFWRNGILLNRYYVDALPWTQWLSFFLGRGLGYVLFNASIWLLAIWAVVRALREPTTQSARFELAVALWGAVTLCGVAIGGRFFGHYFLPSVPAFSLLGARGAKLLTERLRGSPGEFRWKLIAAGLALLFILGLIRSHHRTLVLAYETMTQARTSRSADWGMTKRQDEASLISGFVKGKLNAGEPLYIWGYAHDVYWQTGCRPASRYLTPYYIDGRFVDAEAAVVKSGEEFRRQAAANLIEDLSQARPRLILDVYSSIQSVAQPELVGFIRSNYRDAGIIGPDPERPFRVFELIAP